MTNVASAGGWEEHHLENLQKELEIKKAEAELMKEMAKISPEQMNNIKLSVQGLNEFVKAGGTEELLSSFKSSIKTSIEDIVGEAMAPLQNEITQIVADAFAPLLKDLNSITNQIAQFIGGNATGGVIGAIIGGIAGHFLPGGPLWIAVGAMVGAGIEAALEHAADIEVESNKPGEEGEYYYVYVPFYGYVRRRRDTQTTDFPLHGYIKELE